MTDMRPHPASAFFPTSWLGLLVGCSLIGAAAIASGLQITVGGLSGSAVFIVLVAGLATLPRGLKPTGVGLRGTVTQRTSGRIYSIVIVVGAAAATATGLTREPMWGYVVGGVILAAAFVMSIGVRINRTGARPSDR